MVHKKWKKNHTTLISPPIKVLSFTCSNSWMHKISKSNFGFWLGNSTFIFTLATQHRETYYLCFLPFAYLWLLPTSKLKVTPTNVSKMCTWTFIVCISAGFFFKKEEKKPHEMWIEEQLWGDACICIEFFSS